MQMPALRTAACGFHIIEIRKQTVWYCIRDKNSENRIKEKDLIRLPHLTYLYKIKMHPCYLILEGLGGF